MSGSKKTLSASALAIIEEYGPEKLTYGSYIPPDIIERHIEPDRMHRDYSFSMMRIREDIGSWMMSKNGRKFILVQSESGLRVCTPEESADLVVARFNAKERSMRYWYLMGCEVLDDHLDCLPDQKREEWLQNRRYMRKMLLSMEREALDGSEE